MENDLPSFNELFPMSMSSIEKFHWFDDSEAYPNVVFCRMQIAGKLDEAIAREAWQIAVERQPFADVEPKKSAAAGVGFKAREPIKTMKAGLKTGAGLGLSFKS